ncbi:hypothetical protein QFC19_001826 [Naganishia cerealis]|uniref:Uncharacterized protein n=1 Tax=Naganishia cerealis TaxID=610337 RepID=A0ACC2WH17_9TREE|nr:hypothetical protein QFC19_001826 [Naganishia cerealis]
MGGNAFTDSGIAIIRIDDHLYSPIASTFQQVLGEFYLDILLPPSAPGKPDHGDIDFLVSDPVAWEGEEELENAIGRSLQARAVFRNNALTSYAVPHPFLPDVCIQVDTQLCDPAYLSWIYFITSFGDLVPILGSIHHKFGLIINDKGFWVQLDPPKHANMCGISRNAMVVFLTIEPKKMLEFLGLDDGRYKDGFTCQEQIFQWVRAGKFFRPISKKSGGTHTFQETELNSSNPGDSSISVNPVGASHANANTIPKRRMLTAFADDSYRYPPSPLSKSTPGDVALEAVTFFGKQEEYDAALQYCLSEVQEFEFWKQVRSGLPGSSSRKTRVVRSLKKWVIVVNGQPSIGEQPVEQSTLAQVGDTGRLERLEWIKEHWEEVYNKEKSVAEQAS